MYIIHCLNPLHAQSIQLDGYAFAFHMDYIHTQLMLVGKYERTVHTLSFLRQPLLIIAIISLSTQEVMSQFTYFFNTDLDRQRPRKTQSNGACPTTTVVTHIFLSDCLFPTQWQSNFSLIKAAVAYKTRLCVKAESATGGGRI